MINLGFLTEGKPAAILITPSSWGSQRAGHSPRTRTDCQLGNQPTPAPTPAPVPEPTPKKRGMIELND
jgi:hypothetical protein